MTKMNKDNNTPEQLLKQAQALADDIFEMETIDAEAAYQAAESKARHSRRMTIYNKVMRYAAILALPLLVSTLVLGYMQLRGAGEPERMVTVTAAAGSVLRYELPDHSVVWLNSGTKLTHPTVFSHDERDVSLDGEGYFEVTANSKRPFYVNTPSGLSVYVYGTKFNVSTYSDDDFIATVLERGHVNVVTPEKKTLVMAPGEQIIYNKLTHGYECHSVDVYEKTAWKDGKMVFRDAPLDDILKRLGRHFNVEMVYRNHSGRTLNYRATFRTETLPQILDYFAKSAPIKWTVIEPQRQNDNTLTRKKVVVDLY